VGIVADQIGFHKTMGNSLGFCFVAARFQENPANKILQQHM
jgi:hypothetical protein